ncbi:MAG: alcohol dehydrogenase [Candidatus Binatia bacterium]|nr:MAG: alcohol dehydrogenase [Candidatus Binatia bacterium]
MLLEFGPVRALFFDGRDAGLRDVPRPHVEPGFALVRVSLAGICRTDLELVRGYMQFRGILGHEFVGVVEEGPEEWCGKRVVGEINFACGRCGFCASGLGRHCPNRRVLGILGADGTMAEYVVVPTSNLHAVPDSVPDEVAVFTEPVAAAFEILEQVHVVPGMRALVFGDGKLGLLVAQVLHAAGARVRVVGKHAEKLALAESLGLEATRFPCAERAPLVVDATGAPDGFSVALAATEPRGTLVLKTTVAETRPVETAKIVVDEIRVVGSRCGNFLPALRALEAGTVRVRPLVSAVFPLSEAERAFEAARQPGMLKVLLAAR